MTHHSANIGPAISRHILPVKSNKFVISIIYFLTDLWLIVPNAATSAVGEVGVVAAPSSVVTVGVIPNLEGMMYEL